MEHLRLAMGFMAFVSVLTFLITVRGLRSASAPVLDGLGFVILVLTGAYIWFVWDQLWIVQWIPLPSVIVLSNWFPILMAILAAILWIRMSGHPWWRRVPAQLALVVITIWSVVSVILADPPVCEDKWLLPEPPVPFRICQQTHSDTCSAAATATILEALGISTTESEMAQLCLTRDGQNSRLARWGLTSGGTTWLGMYHGLSIKLMATGFQATFFESSPEELERFTAEYPVLLCCQLSEEVAREIPEYREDDGWIPGVQHSVVCFGRIRDSFLIGDPSQPRLEIWSTDDMRNLWTGTGLQIVLGK